MLVPVTVKVVDGVTAVGVPLSSPVDESRDSPAGREGDTDQVTTVPPLE